LTVGKADVGASRRERGTRVWKTAFIVAILMIQITESGDLYIDGLADVCLVKL
jgi:hypothetical protein